MPLPDSYTLKLASIPAYFDAILDAQPPERFSLKFLENLGFTSTNDRLFIGVLKDIGFLNRDGTPLPRYFEFLDRSRSKQILALGIKDAYSDLYAINTKAHELSAEDVKNKLRTLYAGAKTDLVIGRIATTFKALTEYADFSGGVISTTPQVTTVGTPEKVEPNGDTVPPIQSSDIREGTKSLTVSTLQYHINIVLPDTRDQAVFDAIFKSLRTHLG